MNRSLWAMLLGMVLALPACAGRGAKSPAEDDFTRLRKRMVEMQMARRGISNSRILDAFRKVKRHLFVPESLRNEAYEDYPLPIGEEQTISQPYIVAYMTEVLEPAPHMKILEIGTGSGYQAAILAGLVREVYTIEIKKELAERSRKLLEKLGYQNIHCRTGDGYLGWPEQAPFDAVIVTCSPEGIPPPLLEQLAPGGRLVIPVTYPSGNQELVLVEKDERGWLKEKRLLPVRFVPLVRREEKFLTFSS